MRAALVLIVLLVMPGPSLAHDGGAIPADVWAHWNADPLILIALLLCAAVYTRGAATYPVAAWRNAAFMAGLIVLFIALVSPLGAVSHALFSAHMVQHLLLMLAAAPLLTLGRPIAALLRGLPRSWREAFGSVAQRPPVRSLWSRLTQPVIASALHIAALVIWHLPGPYELALDNPAIHALEHATFFFSAALFWWAVRSSKDYGLRILSVFGVMMTSGLLGALMTFASSPWYRSHEIFVSAWGLTALADQQLAGLYMWIPAGFVYVVTVALLMGAWLTAVGERVAANEIRLSEETSDA
jgi:cytochrome c oxidase assembly factor CtaG